MPFLSQRRKNTQNGWLLANLLASLILQHNIMIIQRHQYSHTHVR
jgi:hypothetical protein